jgi:tetratricopeptide (TPR) repeat protein
MRTTTLVAASFVVVLASTYAPRAFAADRTAELRAAAKEFAAGERAFGAGDYRRAADAFEAAYRASPHHAPLWNAARSCLRSGQDVRAANLLERYLRIAPADAPDRDHATAALAEVSPRVGRIELHRALAREVELDDTATSAAVVYVAPGEHVIRATGSDGTEIVRRMTVAAGAVVSISLEPADGVAPATSTNTSTTTRTTAMGREEGRKNGLSPWFVVAGGAATATAGGLAMAFGLGTIESRNAFRADPTPERYDAAVRDQMRTNVALVTTGLLAVATGAVAVFLVDWKGR